jgi:hypothetical protein
MERASERESERGRVVKSAKEEGREGRRKRKREILRKRERERREQRGHRGGRGGGRVVHRFGSKKYIWKCKRDNKHEHGDQQEVEGAHTGSNTGKTCRQSFKTTLTYTFFGSSLSL